MATYTPAQMARSGVLSTQPFTSGSTVTITITDKPSREVGSTYFTVSVPSQDPSLPLYFVGSTFVPTNVGGIEVDTAGNHWACVIPSGGGTSSLTWTTAVTIPLGGVYIQGTGGIGATMDNVVTTSLITYYDPATSYSGTGTTLIDLSGNNRNATIVGNPLYTSGEGGYFTLSNDYIALPNLNSIITADDEAHSVEVWIYPTDNGVIASYQGNPYSTGYHFSAIDLVSGQVEFGLWDGTTITSTGPTGALTLNAWHQVVLTYNGDGFPVRGYIDGVLVSSTANMNWNSPMDDSAPSFYIAFGAADITNQGDGSYFDGRMGIIRMYNRALTATEVLQNFENDRDQYGI
jgi:hypothetical protein